MSTGAGGDLGLFHVETIMSPKLAFGLKQRNCENPPGPRLGTLPRQLPKMRLLIPDILFPAIAPSTIFGAVIALFAIALGPICFIVYAVDGVGSSIGALAAFLVVTVTL